jgi:hypothetical protein
VGFEQFGDVGRKLPIAILRHDRVRFVTRPSTAWCADPLTRRLLLPPPMLMTCARWLRHPGGRFQRLGLDLPDPLAREIELLADLFEGVLALAADAEAQPDDLLLSRREGLQDAGGFR